MTLHQVFLVVLALAPEAMPTENCNTNSDTLSFSTNISDEDYVRRGMYEEIYCCAANFKGNVTWSRYIDGAFVEFPPPDDRDSYVFKQRGQVLIIRKVRMRDNGTFVCTATNGADSVTFRIELHVLECPQAAGKAMPLRKPDPKQYTSVGKRLVLPCLADFGCGIKSFRRVIWMVRSPLYNGPLEGESPYFSVRAIDKSNGTILGKELTFKEVTPDNFTATYTCILSDLSKHPDKFPVVLVMEATTEVIPIWYIVLPCAILVVAGFAVLVTVLCGYQVEYWLKSKLNIGWPKDCDDMKIGLVSSEESRDFVSDNIYRILRRDYGGNVYYHHESTQNDGRPEATANLEELLRCSHVILFLSEEEEQEKFSQFIINSVPRIKSASKVVIIRKGELKKILQSFDRFTSESLKVVKEFEYPKTQNENGRRMKNFWCGVKLCLPAVKKTSNNMPHSRKPPQRHSSSSSSSVLLQDDINVET